MTSQHCLPSTEAGDREGNTLSPSHTLCPLLPLLLILFSPPRVLPLITQPVGLLNNSRHLVRQLRQSRGASRAWRRQQRKRKRAKAVIAPCVRQHCPGSSTSTLHTSSSSFSPFVNTSYLFLSCHHPLSALSHSLRESQHGASNRSYISLI